MQRKINLFLFLSRTFSITKYHDKKTERTYNNSGSLTEETTTATTTTTTTTSNNLTNGETVNDEKCDSTTTSATDVNAPEVFLGGSCNPTTWRADVAIPALNEFNISFYNPVSFFFLILIKKTFYLLSNNFLASV